MGGEWNFDRLNRRPLPRSVAPPPPLRFEPDAITRQVMSEVEARGGGMMGVNRHGILLGAGMALDTTPIPEEAVLVQPRWGTSFLSSRLWGSDPPLRHVRCLPDNSCLGARNHTGSCSANAHPAYALISACSALQLAVSFRYNTSCSSLTM
ncbi:MAG: cryptochrome/photolyase family protein [Roseiflexus sp.]|nr:cryptochrome/photolyase family protein [Roseiflexus sp.]